ncbi:MAG: penicillin-binding protein beta-lactamase class, partial [Verrucomicrobiales bacterium]|nr:penicillin-binding protein beta-lactamase class [Verrucomicrobiales bacterium]
EATGDTASKVSKKKFNFPANPQKIESLSLDFSNAREPVLDAHIGGKEYLVPCGSLAWKKGKFVHPTLGDQLAAGSGAWTSGDTYSAKIVLYETPFHVTLRCRFEGDQLKLDTEYNVAFGARTLPQLVGTP